ncbi:Holliday junction ATP-dependent DNA helicase RuvB [Planctomycetes bacterium LzC2]|uniref:Holliday junction branch migration complex subunit RuvB n=2 Tax=Alienimonas chondri TaxID=2681879 RepID=A0ABX1V9B8_9PLAN|nr:Holliday junction branch migration DNA helicase RuvB [Alienimonas chondri]NNJ24659.1 Holliday junction ATP-dependent DNA helicase RuvB [Alienimonas chondri]
MIRHRRTARPTASARSALKPTPSPKARMARQPTYRSETDHDAGPADEPAPKPRRDRGEPDDTPAVGTPDAEFENSLRPRRLSEVVGQRKVVERLSITLDAARRRGEPLGHLLLDGPPGLGKTTLATVVPRELATDGGDGEIQYTSGPALRAPHDLVAYLTCASRGSVLFIDEIHRLPPAVEEYLYSAMEDFRVDIVMGEGTGARTVSLNIEPFTVIGATTRSGMLTAPLRDRFVNHERVEYYEVDDLAEIVRRNAVKLGLTTEGDAAQQLARRSRGTPRKANNLLRWCRDFAQVHSETGELTPTLAARALEMREVDALGLEDQDRRYLRTIIEAFVGGPVGLTTLSHALSVPTDTLEDEVEPYLLRCGLMQRTSRGRVVTPKAWDHLGLDRTTDDSSLF